MAGRPYKLDRINRRILEALQLNAILTNQELAEKVHLSASACHSRVRALEAAGVIRRYITDIDVDRIAPNLNAFIEISLESHRPTDFQAFDDLIARHPEIVWSYKVSGTSDYRMLAIVPNMGRLRELTDSLLDSGVGISNLTTIPVIEKVKAFAGVPIRAVIIDADPE